MVNALCRDLVKNRRIALLEVIKKNRICSTKKMVQYLREIRFENYSFWAYGDIQSNLSYLLQEGYIHRINNGEYTITDKGRSYQD